MSDIELVKLGYIDALYPQYLEEEGEKSDGDLFLY
jgi:hypothetical protein